MNESAWHRGGTVVPCGLGLEDALRHGGLLYPVAKKEAYVISELRKASRWNRLFNREIVWDHAAGCHVIWREDTGTALGQVGNEYVERQNLEVFKPLSILVDSGLCEVEVAGTLRGGVDAWALLRFDTEKMIENAMSLGEGEKVEVDYVIVEEDFDEMLKEIVPYGLILNNHSGRHKARLRYCAIRGASGSTILLSTATSGSPLPRTGDAWAVYDAALRRYVEFADQRWRLRKSILSIEDFKRLVLEVAVPMNHLESSLERFVEKGKSTTATEKAIEKAKRRRGMIADLWFTGEGHIGDQSAWEAVSGLCQALEHDELFEPRDGDAVRSMIEGHLGKIRRTVFEGLLQEAAETA